MISIEISRICGGEIVTFCKHFNETDVQKDDLKEISIIFKMSGVLGRRKKRAGKFKTRVSADK